MSRQEGPRPSFGAYDALRRAVAAVSAFRDEDDVQQLMQIAVGDLDDDELRLTVAAAAALVGAHADPDRLDRFALLIAPRGLERL